MPEKDCHIAGLNGFETVRLAGELTGLPSLDAARRAHEVLYLVGLGEQRYRPVAGYSTGMRQKVKLATALVHDPELLFLDEPTNGLDPSGRVDMLRLIRSLVSDLGKSVVLSSHILQDVESICPEVVLLERGVVLAAGPVRELTGHAARLYHLEATGDPSVILSQLVSAGITGVEQVADRHYQLTIPEPVAVATVFTAVRSAGGAVHELVEHRRTLEEVFLGAVRLAAESRP
jgi:ABC-2 type transport system ATP-binding protein